MSKSEGKNADFDSSPRPSPRSTKRGRIILWGRFPGVGARGHRTNPGLISFAPSGQVSFRLQFIPARQASLSNQRASALISGSKLCVQFDTSPRALSPIEAERVNWFAVHYGPVTITTRKPTSESGQFAKRKNREADRLDELS